jgi:LuxR family transcriptional regulator, maltose regulon positive regulatory protein
MMLAAVLQASGDKAGAIGALGEAERTAQRNNVERFVTNVAAYSARLALLRGDVAGAARWAATHDFGEHAAFDLQSAYVALTLARLYVAQRDGRRSLRITGPLLEQARAGGVGSVVIEALLIEALAYAALNQSASATRQLRAALDLAAAGPYLRLFIDAGAPLAALLRDLGPDMPAYGRTLMTALLEANNATAQAAQSLVEPLSERELEVLRLLAVGSSNAAIAEKLVITVGTVKRHVNNIYGKLDAHNRTEAVAKARAAGLLS